MKFVIRGLLAIVAVCLFASISVAEAQVTYTIGGNLSGLSGGAVILKNGSDTLNISSNGDFTFATPMASGALYAVSVLIQPPNQACSVSGGDNGNGSGTVGNANVTSVSVNCVSTYTVGGTLSGLAAPGLVLRLNATSLIIANGATSFKFSTALTNGMPYTVSVGIQPVGYTCTVSGGSSGNGSGTIASANVINIAVACSKTYTIGGTITGLTGAGLRITLNGGASKLIASNATSYVFSTTLISGTSYTVTIQAQPSGLTCSVSNNTGSIGASNVINVNVSCLPATYTIGGNLFGLTGSVTLNNYGDVITLSASGPFTFPAALTSGSNYGVVVDNQPAGQTCTVLNGTGTVASSNITTVNVTCVTSNYTLAGNVFGLSGTVVLQNTINSSQLTVNANGGFIFSTPINYGGAYNVTVLTQPVGQTCKVISGAGTNLSSNVWGIVVTCSSGATTYTVGGLMNNGMASNTITLTNARDNGSENLNVTTNGTANTYPFAFLTVQSPGGTYNVTSGKAGSNPCVVSNGTGVITSANVTTLVVTCAKATTGNYTVGGSISGLAGTVVLSLAGSQTVTLPAGATSFTFPTPVAAGSYTVSVSTQPATQTCAVANGNVTLDGTQAVNNISVTCVSNSLVSKIGGTISGLGSGESITLLDNGGDKLLMLGNGNFTFATPVIIGSQYAVTVGVQPISQLCTVTNGTGTSPGGAAITSVGITCAADTRTFTVGGNVTGLTQSVTLLDNGGDSKAITANGSFAFPSALNSGSSYVVTIGTQPPGQTCFLFNNSGVNIIGNVTSVTVECSNNTYQIGGRVNGLTGAGLLLQMGNQTLPVNVGSSTFVFNSSLATGSLYTVFINAQPLGQTCTVTNGTDTLGSSDISSVLVSCATAGATEFNVVIGRPTESSVVVSILGGNNDWGGSAYVTYGTDSNAVYPYTSATVTSSVVAYPSGSTHPVIEVPLTGLATNTKYYYRVNYKTKSGATYIVGNEHSFNTQRLPGSTFTFGVQGDSHPERSNDTMFHSELYQLTMAEIAKRQPDMYFMLGDDFSTEAYIANFEKANYPGVASTAFNLAQYGPGGTLSSYSQYQALPSPFVQLNIGETTSTGATGSGQYLGQRLNYLSLMAHSTHLFMVNGNHEQNSQANLGGIFNNNAVFAASARNKFYPEPIPTSFPSWTKTGAGFYSGDTEALCDQATNPSCPITNPLLHGYPGVDGDGLLRDYYAFEWGDALFITIDPYWHSPSTVDNAEFSDPVSTWQKTMGDDQYFWLKNVLENSTKKYKFLFSHHINGTGRGAAAVTMVGEWGGDSSGAFATNRQCAGMSGCLVSTNWPKPIHQLLVDTKSPNGFTIFFQGHDHAFSREEVDGVIYQEVPNPADNSYWAYNCSAYAPASIGSFPSEFRPAYGNYDASYSVAKPNSGFVYVTVSPQQVKLQYIRTYRSIDILLDANKALYDSLAGHANGEVAFTYTLTAGQPYSVVANGDDLASNNHYACKGDAPASGYVYNHYSVGGTVSGLASGRFVTLVMNGSNPLTISSNGSFTIPTTITGGNYSVTVGAQPSGQTCNVTSGSGTITSYPNGANVNNVSVTCSP